jgi:hypothetical protein
LTANKLLLIGKKEVKIKNDVKTLSPGDYNNGLGVERNIKLEILIILTRI